MLRIVCVLFILGLYKYCHGTQIDEWKQHFYQLRRDYSNRTQNERSYLPKIRENLQSQVSFGLLIPRIETKMNQSTETNIGVRQSLNQWRSDDSQNESTFRRRLIRESFENNTLKQNEIGLKNDEDSLRTNINAKPKKLITFRSRKSQNTQLRNSIRTPYDTKQNDNLQKDYNQENLIFSDCCSVTSNVLLIRNYPSKSVTNDRNSFQRPDYLPPLYNTTIYKAPEYLPPNERPYYTIKNITNNHFTKTVTVTQASTPLPSIFETNTYKGEEYDPAKAMQVPAEEEEGMVNIIPLPPKNDQADKGIPSAEGVELKANIPRNVTTTFRPVGVNERGDVPDDESTLVESSMAITVASKDLFTLTTDVPSTQPTIYTSKIVTTATKMTLMSTDRSITSNKEIPMQTFESGPTTHTNMRNTTPFKGLEYLPPDDTTMKTTEIPTTLQSHEPAPAMAMPVPPEPEDTPPIPPPATVSPAPTTTVDASFMTPGNRHQTEVDLPMNTTPFSGPEYLPPKEPRIPTATTSSGVVPAMPVPPEPEDVPISTSSPTSPTTPTDVFRAAESPSSTSNTPIDTNFKASEYLPPKEVQIPPSPAMAIPVPKESDCDNDPNNTPNIDPRFVDTDSCGNKMPTEPSAELHL